jgi:hypothetical protein
MNTVQDTFPGNGNQCLVFSGKSGVTATGQYHTSTVVFHNQTDSKRLIFEKHIAYKIVMICYTIKKIISKIKAISKDVTISIGIKCHIHLDLGYTDDVKIRAD